MEKKKKKKTGRGVGRGETETMGQNQMGRRRWPLGRSPSLIKVVKRKGKLVVGRVEGDPRCLGGFVCGLSDGAG